MRTFLRYIGFLFLAVWAALVALDWGFTGYLQNHPPKRNAMARVLALHGQTISYVFMGNSRVESTIYAPIIEKATAKRTLNLGTASSNMADMLLYTQLLLEQNNQIEQLWLQVDFNYNYVGSSTLVRSNAMPYLFDHPTIGKFIDEYDENEQVYRVIPFARYMINNYSIGLRNVLKNAVYKGKKAHDPEGFFERNGPFTDYNTRLPDSLHHINPELADIRKLCQKNQVKLVLFTAPFSTTTQNLVFIDALKSRYPDLKDYSRIFTNDSLYFVDNVHLNGEGAKAFTRQLLIDL